MKRAMKTNDKRRVRIDVCDLVLKMKLRALAEERGVSLGDLCREIFSKAIRPNGNSFCPKGVTTRRRKRRITKHDGSRKEVCDFTGRISK